MPVSTLLQSSSKGWEDTAATTRSSWHDLVTAERSGLSKLGEEGWPET